MARGRRRPPRPLTGELTFADGIYTWELEDGHMTVRSPAGRSKGTQLGGMEPEELAGLLAAELGARWKWEPGELVQLSDASLAVVRAAPRDLSKHFADGGLVRLHVRRQHGKLAVSKISPRTASAGARRAFVPPAEVRRLPAPARGLVLDRGGWRASIDGQCGPLSVAVEFRSTEATVHAEYIRPGARAAFRWSEDVRAHLSDVLQLEAAHWIERAYGHGL